MRRRISEAASTARRPEDRASVSPPQKRSQARDPHKLRLNSYRVLLTRGRDGSTIYVPDGGTDFDADYQALKVAGAVGL